MHTLNMKGSTSKTKIKTVASKQWEAIMLIIEDTRVSSTDKLKKFMMLNFCEISLYWV